MLVLLITGVAFRLLVWRLLCEFDPNLYFTIAHAQSAISVQLRAEVERGFTRTCRHGSTIS